ncbi:S24 family peptidase [Entomomonas asaccharolytica]|uniref:S24 family peptidase n=1 Tax=Entomomonas asaccharolytica TaxID=2785331 RepID=A0A974NEX3_9GAMM|nr:S24 family peptidase [Entomomonas asaccharolytica]QQP85470.1 S24 family peptidase [Entomomonas asaccharolytica]
MYLQIDQANNGLIPIDPSLKLVLLHGIDDFMSNTFYNGDLLLIDTRINTLDCDSIYEIKLQGQHLIRRIQRMPSNQLLLIPDNKHYQLITLNQASLLNFEVIGRVIQSWKAQRH